MAETIPDLWGDGIQVDDLSPLIILNTQAAILQKRTKGIITAEVIKRTSKDVTELLFDIKGQVARHRSRLLVCRYLGIEVYPVWITSETLRRGLDMAEGIPSVFHLDDDMYTATWPAFDQQQFNELVGEVFQSKEVKAKISSMVALSNEAKQPLDHLIEDANRSA